MEFTWAKERMGRRKDGMSPRAIIAVREREEGKAKSNQRKYAITQNVHFPRNAAAAPATRVGHLFGHKQL